ncbi:MAG: helix-turn-helix domain-containing protein [Janthinobacterium lividum]
MPERLPRLFTVAAAAAQLDCHPETLRRAIRRGDLACYRLGGCTRIAPDQLSAYLEAALCPARDPQDLSSSSTGASGPSAGGTMDAVDSFRQARRTRRALDKPSRISPASASSFDP